MKAQRQRQTQSKVVIDMHASEQADTFVIRSVRNDGSKFRPSDWIERISATLASFNTGTSQHATQGAKPCIIDGEKCLVVESQLAKTNLAAYEFIMNFAYSNDLRIQKDRRTDSHTVLVDRRSADE